MNYLKDLIEFVQRLFVWWIIVSPWERGLRVRGGKKIKVLNEGIHFRIPFYDTTYVQAVRLRVTSIPLQTVTTLDNQTLTIVSSIGYSFEDIRKVFESVSNPVSTIANIVMGEISTYVCKNYLSNCLPDAIEVAVMEKLKESMYGIKFESFNITGYAVVKTYRLLQDGHYMPDNINIDQAK